MGHMAQPLAIADGIKLRLNWATSVVSIELDISQVDGQWEPDGFTQ